MVRLETFIKQDYYNKNKQVYIPVWLDQKHIITEDLTEPRNSFTFHYVQIRNYPRRAYNMVYNEVYIPVWLDQKH